MVGRQDRLVTHIHSSKEVDSAKICVSVSVILLREL